MTEITHRRVTRIALPIILSNVTIPLLGAVDTGVVGQLGAAAPIGAVGLGAVILASIYWVFGFLRMGTTGLVAQATGAGDGSEATAILVRGLIIGAGAGLLLVALQGPLIAGAFRLAPASAEVEDLARQYLVLRIWGAPATIMLYAVTGWLIAVERTRAVLLLQLVMNGLNIALDLAFVLGLGWGVPGVAVATLIAEFAGLGLGLWLCRAAFGPALQDRARLWSAHAWRRLLGVNSDIMLRSILLQGSFTTFTFLGAGFGDVTLAANQVLLQFLEIIAYALDGFAFAAESLVGQAFGARRRHELELAVKRSSQQAVLGSALLTLAFALLGPLLIDIMATAPEVREAARGYLPWLLVMPMISVGSYMLDGIFIGATRTRDMRNTMAMAVVLYAGALVVLIPLWGNHGLWAALLVLNAARAVTMARRYPRIVATLEVSR